MGGGEMTEIDDARAAVLQANIRGDIGGRMIKCFRCGKWFMVGPEWAYKHIESVTIPQKRTRYYCSWNCLRENSRELEAKKRERREAAHLRYVAHKQDMEGKMRFDYKRPDRDKTTGEKLTLSDCCNNIIAAGFAKSLSSAKSYLTSHIPKEQYYQTHLMEYIKQRAKKEGRQCKIWKAGSGMYSAGGVSDIIGVVDGVFIAVEVKRPMFFEISKLQEKFISDIEEAGGIGCIATYPEDVDELLWKRLEDRDGRKV